jgi:hypothetical protein
MARVRVHFHPLSPPRPLNSGYSKRGSSFGPSASSSSRRGESNSISISSATNSSHNFVPDLLATDNNSSCQLRRACSSSAARPSPDRTNQLCLGDDLPTHQIAFFFEPIEMEAWDSSSVIGIGLCRIDCGEFAKRRLTRALLQSLSLQTGEKQSEATNRP